MTDFHSVAPAEQARRLHRLGTEALRSWGMDRAELTELKIRENAVYRVDLDDGDKAVLRIHRGGYHSDQSLRSEFVWMEALRRAGVETPTNRPAVDGHPFVVLDHDFMDCPRQIDVIDWIDGEQLGDVEQVDEIEPADLAHRFRSLGVLAARMHDQSSRWSEPASFERHAWNAEGIAGDAPVWGRFWELPALSPTERALMLRARDTIRHELDAYGETDDRYGLIHGDLVGENVMVDGETLRLIDFDDCGFGHFLFELATSLNFYADQPSFRELESALVAGYRTHRPLSSEDVALLPLFLMARSTTYLGWVHSHPNTETAREQTPMLIDMACRRANEYFDQRSRHGEHDE